MKIDFCIPYIGAGFRYLEHLLQNAKETADHPENITFRVSFHSAEDRKLLEPIKDQFGSIVQAKSFQDRNIMFWASANHSAAINALARECAGDLSVFCDFDMAFLEKGWDSRLLMASMDADIMGVPYLPVPLSVSNKFIQQAMPYLEHAPLWKYQERPNLSFMAIKGSVMREVFKGRITEFDTFLGNHGIPFQIVNNAVTGSATGLPAGSIWWMDTGFEIPRIIMDHNLKYIVFPHGPIDRLKGYKEDEGIFLTPEVFWWGDKPFIAHFKKGHAKAHRPGLYSWDDFKKDVATPEIAC